MDDDAGALPKKVDFSEWYNELLWRAEIMDVRYPVKGLYVWFPYGFAIRKFVYQRLRELLDQDHQETLFPLLIPEQEFMKEAEHIKGFENEVYWVTHGGTTPLDVKLALRPTSETAIYPMYALWVRSHADLPLKLYQIVNTFRYETKQTRPMIRAREITSFMESHTVHATWDEAEAQVESEIVLTREFYRSLCIPIIISKRPDWDKFPGADYTIAVDAIMPNGKTLQIGTVHHLGEHFSKTFSISYEDKNGEQKLVNQTCYGISERCIAALISMHGDDKGLILPPVAAPVQAIIVPITIGKRHEDVMAAAEQLHKDLTAAGVRVKLDTRDMRPGAKYYWWELRGVPLRLELGPRDLDAGKVMAVKRTGEKTSIEMSTALTGSPGYSKRSPIPSGLQRKNTPGTTSAPLHPLTLSTGRSMMEKLPWCTGARIRAAPKLSKKKPVQAFLAQTCARPTSARAKAHVSSAVNRAKRPLSAAHTDDTRQPMRRC